MLNSGSFLGQKVPESGLSCLMSYRTLWVSQDMLDTLVLWGRLPVGRPLP